jgi:hypothetical protein
LYLLKGPRFAPSQLAVTMMGSSPRSWRSLLLLLLLLVVVVGVLVLVLVLVLLVLAELLSTPDDGAPAATHIARWWWCSCSGSGATGGTGSRCRLCQAVPWPACLLRPLHTMGALCNAGGGLLLAACCAYAAAAVRNRGWRVGCSCCWCCGDAGPERSGCSSTNSCCWWCCPARLLRGRCRALATGSACRQELPAAALKHARWQACMHAQLTTPLLALLLCRANARRATTV